MFKTLQRFVVVTLLACAAFGVRAEQSAQDVVQKTVDTLLNDITTNKAKYQADPNSFHQSLERILTPFVDVNGITRGVMTVRYSREATPQQMQRFQDNFKNSLLNFYGNALLEYDSGVKVRMLPPQPEQEPGRAVVNMEIQGKSGAIYPVSYTMMSMDNTWKMRNVVINGINIGKLFRDQFAESMQRNGGNLDKTIDTWSQSVAQAKSKADAEGAQRK